jgi:hypothetical protein
MNKNDEKALQHAMTSFALFGGFLVGPRHRPGRVESKPQDYVPTPRKPR